MNSSDTLKFTPLKIIKLKEHPDISESLIQKLLFENPNILGLGNLYARDKERILPSGGRLDLLFQDTENSTRYEIEVQLGATDETHIIRTIEYWDIERKRFPQYDHVAVIVAEDITARFFNVISLFNSSVPIVALKMTAVENQDGTLSLLFTKILDIAIPSIEEEDTTFEQTNRQYWEKNSSKEILKIADDILNFVKEFAPKAAFSYNKLYLGIWIDGKPKNFAIFRPKRQYFYLDIKLERDPEIDNCIEQSVFEEVDYKPREGRYRFRVNSQTSEEGLGFLKQLLKKAYE